MPNVTYKHIGMTALAIGSLFLAIPFALSPNTVQAAAIFVVPAILTALYIIFNPYFGTFMFYLFDYFRPTDIITPLRSLHLPLAIEILTLVSWIFFLIRTRNTIKWSYFNWVCLAFIAVIASTIITAMNNRFAYDSFQALVINFLFLVIASNVVTTPKRLWQIIWLFMIVTFYFAIRGLFNFAVLGFVSAGARTSGIVGSGYIGDENDFALAIDVMIPFAFIIFTNSKGLIKRLSSLIILIVYVMAVVASMSRGGWLGLLAVCIYCILKTKHRVRSLAISALLAGTVLYFAPQAYWDKIKTIFNTEEGTARSRINYWKAGYRMFRDYPITGVGAGNGGVRMPEYISGVRNPYTQWGRTFHGTFPQILAELGSLGLFCYLLMLFLALKQLHKLQKRKLAPGDDTAYIVANSVIGGVIGYLVAATFLSTAYYPQLWILYTLTMILTNIVYAGGQDQLEIHALPEEKAVAMAEETG